MKLKLLLLFAILAATIFAQQHANVLTWQWSQGTGDPATGYHVKKATTSGGPYVTIATLTGTATTTYADVTVTSGQTNFYVVTAFNNGGDSSPSNQVTCVTPFQAPTAPTSLLSTSK